MKTVSRRHSLSTKLLVSVILWVVCAVTFTGYTLGLLWQLEGGGVAINHAGSLRMQVYRMLASSASYGDTDLSLSIMGKEFVTTLERLRDIDHTCFLLLDTSPIRSRIDTIESDFSTKILPRIKAQKANTPLPDIDDFVRSINELVSLVENKNTQTIIWIRSIQGILVVMVIFSAFTGVFLLYHLVIRPLEILQGGIHELGRENLSTRIPIQSRDEFGIVSSVFNQMAENLQDLYSNLEKKVSEKTASLEQRNLELASLYGTTSLLRDSPSHEAACQGFLQKLVELSHARYGVIKLTESSLYPSEYQVGGALEKGIRDTPDTFPIYHNNNGMGRVTLYFDRDELLPPQTRQLIETLIHQLAVTLENHQLALSDKQLAIMEERSLIAQGLHDSIAQSLSFLNLQVQMLQNAVSNNELEQAKKILVFIQQGVQESYEDVRELLLNFRTKINKDDFRNVINKLLERLRAQTKISISSVGLDKEPILGPQQKLQTVFILQEALSNIRKHSKAANVEVKFKNDDDFVMTVTDDGCGFDKELLEEKKNRHVGLTIMQERASKIVANVEIDSVLNRGTRVTLTIPEERKIES